MGSLDISYTILLLLFSCGQTDNKAKEQTHPMPGAEQIKIADLQTVLTRLQNRQLVLDFFGITSNGADCIYFVPESALYAIEFEVMTEDQKPWLHKLQTFAQENNYKTVMITYNNEPHYKSSEPAPVLRIETKSDLHQTSAIGHSIMKQVFGNNDQTIYEVVP